MRSSKSRVQAEQRNSNRGMPDSSVHFPVSGGWNEFPGQNVKDFTGIARCLSSRGLKARPIVIGPPSSHSSRRSFLCWSPRDTIPAETAPNGEARTPVFPAEFRKWGSKFAGDDMMTAGERHRRPAASGSVTEMIATQAAATAPAGSQSRPIRPDHLFVYRADVPRHSRPYGNRPTSGPVPRSSNGSGRTRSSTC